MKVFEQNIINLYDGKGKQWLDNLPKLIAQMEKKMWWLSQLLIRSSV